MRTLLLSLIPLAVAFAQTPLEETRWRLVELDGKPAASPPGARQIYVRLAAQRVEGFAGCNTVSGSYTRDGEALKFSGLVSTRMACPSLDIESSFNRAIGQTVRFALEGGRLTLLDAAGAKLARFEPDDPWQKGRRRAGGDSTGGGAAERRLARDAQQHIHAEHADGPPGAGQSE